MVCQRSRCARSSDPSLCTRGFSALALPFPLCAHAVFVRSPFRSVSVRARFVEIPPPVKLAQLLYAQRIDELKETIEADEAEFKCV